jgi:hypothetical protein
MRSAATRLAAVPEWSLTIRRGPQVERRGFEDLDQALAALRDEAVAASVNDRLGKAEGLRTYSPGERVAVRLELRGGGWLRGRSAGVDVMGDGALVPYSGAVRRERLGAESPGEVVDVLREALA